MLDFFVTLSLFNCTLLAVPLFLFSFIFLKFSRTLWLNSISFIHSDVEFLKHHTVRTLLDTHRNQGIICVLLSIKGQAKPETLRRHLQEVVSRKDKSGNYAFPRLRQRLVTRCGQYAWQRCTLDLDQNVVVAPFSYKGRAITEYNVQECVSEIVCKYLPTNCPPWQVIVIPSAEDGHYILLKVHHVLLNEGMNIGDLLPLVPPTRQGSFTSKSPLVNVFKKPKHFGNLREKISEDLSNRWNEFVANFDPLERPELLKNTPKLHEFFAIILITLISLIKECRRGFRLIKSDIFSKIKYVAMQSLKETKKRQINFEIFCYSVLTTFDIRNLIKITFKIFYYFGVQLPIKIPLIIYSEILAIYYCISLKYCPYPHTFVGILYGYIPLLFNSLKELLTICSCIFYAPKIIIQDILFQPELFQTVTLCGRKSVAWSDPVKIEKIKTISKNTSTTETEVMLSAVASCISKYLTQTSHPIPDNLPVTIRNINSNYIFGTGQNIRPEDSVSGVVCLNLPLLDPEKDINQIDNLMEINKILKISLEKQGVPFMLTTLQTKYGILTKVLPSALGAIYLKYLSRKYAVTLTEVTNRYPNVTQKTIWGQEVTCVMYWRPPQANTSISLCLNEYADHIRLGVMCDSQLVPSHQYLVRGFTEFIQGLNTSSSHITS